MKDYDRAYVRHTKSRSYLYTGLITAVLALVMISISILELLNGTRIEIPITGFAAGGFWGITSFICMYVYYVDNRVDLKPKTMDLGDMK